MPYSRYTATGWHGCAKSHIYVILHFRVGGTCKPHERPTRATIRVLGCQSLGPGRTLTQPPSKPLPAHC
ncbi:unnamed protein product [Staurois parvus]|uniref:Uncharacterized protein n=1 Tax=Staurois parvus TaxID=386267 RepID=A0ABN9GFS7_9NEOB|nr:unnamed protein product [Staurois parvus]